jgi:predicted nucleotidyltransferase
MKISPFKTYSISRKTIQNQEVENAVPKASSALFKSEPQSEEAPALSLSSKLIEQIKRNKESLKKSRGISRQQLKNRLLQLLDTYEGDPELMEDYSFLRNGNQRFSSQDTWYLLNMEANVLRYMGNDRDPYWQIRNFRHLSILK